MSVYEKTERTIEEKAALVAAIETELHAALSSLARFKEAGYVQNLLQEGEEPTGENVDGDMDAKAHISTAKDLVDALSKSIVGVPFVQEAITKAATA